MRKGEATKARILEIAADQASVTGFNATSLADVAGASGLSKSAVFKHFPAKESLQLALIEDLTARFVRQVVEPALDKEAGAARLSALFPAWLDWVDAGSWTGGCPLLSAAKEFANQPGPVRDLLSRNQQRWGDRLTQEFAAIPACAADPRQATFDLYGIVLAFSHHRRLLDDPQARAMAKNAFARLIGA